MTADTHAEDVLAGYHIVDCDSHFTEPPDLWTSRAPAKLKDRVPQVKRVDASELEPILDVMEYEQGTGPRDRWYIEGDKDFGPVGLCVVDAEGTKRYDIGVESLPTFESCSPAAYDLKARLELMDELGIWAQVIYPNTAGLSHHKFAQVSDPELRDACISIYNDACADLQRDSEGRLVPMALLPVWDKEAMTKESQRCIGDLGLRGFAISDKPQQLDLPGFRSDYWDSLFGLCSESGAPLNFHVGGDPSASPMFQFAWQDYGMETKVAIWTSLFTLGNARTLLNFCYSGIFDKYQGLNLVSVESGLGWVPYVLESMEFQFDEMMPNEGKALKRRPREYFNDHFFTSFWFEELGPTMPVLEAVGVNNVMLETDFPHPTCLYPHHDHLAKLAKGWPPTVARRILQDNAAELYKVDIPGAAGA